MITRIFATASICSFFFSTPHLLQARSNNIDTGLTLGYDYNDREYETTEVNGIQVSGRDDDYRDIVITPLLHFISAGIKDRFEIRVSPSIKYDTIDSETDWDNDFLIAADRSINKNWRIIGSNTLVRSDYHETTPGSTTDSTSLSSPELSGDYGRTRYWRNSLSLDSEHLYDQESLVNLGFDYILLRNDESDLRSYDDYDRYVGSITNEHRFNQNWSLLSDLSFVRGDFETTGPLTLLTEEDAVSDDLMEYHLLSTLENLFNRQTTLGMSYNYIGTRYDEEIRIDGDIHQLQFTWTYLLSRQTTITLGAGPSYEKSEGRDSNTGGNGIAQYEYQGQRSTVTFGVEKRYGVDNFSGTDERGFVDYWDTRLLIDYQLTPNLTINGQAGYRYEDREDSMTTLLTVNDTSDLQEYNTEQWIAGLGLSYNFSRNYTASVKYTYTDQDSERIGDTYDDHRILVSLSWEQNWLRW